KDTKVTIWVDQLCIDQSNVEERNHQVRLMGRIYGKAQNVVVWLGDEDDNSRAGLKLARKILGLAVKTPDIVLQGDNLESLGLPGRNSKEWRALGAFLRRPWFKRVWVIQEVVMSSKAVVMCGQESLQWDEMVKLALRVNFAINIMSFAGADTAAGRPSQVVLFLIELRDSRRRGNSEDFFRLLCWCRSCEATDPRDKIYALLGLGQYDIAPDYSKSAAEVYMDLAVYHLFQIMPGGPMNGISDRERACWVTELLYCAGDLNTQHSLPSWVPDWKVDFKSRPLCVMHESIYRAGGESLGKVQFCNGPQLRLSGRLWATVKIAGTAELDLRRRMRARELHRMIAAWFAECNRTAAHCPVPLPDGRTPRGSVQANANCQQGGHGQGVFSVLRPLLQRLSFFSPNPPRFRDA
ncbi:MAG: hypothetical protein M1830_005317, partial [Pleopsidium flavum]